MVWFVCGLARNHIMNLQSFLQSQLRHVLTFAGGFGAFLLSHDLVAGDGVEVVNEGMTQVVVGVFAIVGAMLSRLLILLISRFPLLSFLDTGVTRHDSKAGGAGFGDSVPLVLLFCIGAAFAVQGLTSCQALQDVQVGKGRLFVSNADRSAKGGLIFEDGDTGFFGRLVSDNGKVAEFELFPVLQDEEAPVAPLSAAFGPLPAVVPAK